MPFSAIGKNMELKRGTTLVSLLVAGVLATGIVCAAGPAKAAKVYRWVDENGEVHYSESLPPDFQDKGADVLNSKGIVVNKDVKMTPKPPPPPKVSKDIAKELPRDKSGLPRPKAQYSEAEMQSRMDSFLLLRYESEQEILDAMNVEIKQLEYDRRLLMTTRTSMINSYQGEIREAANRQRAGLQVPEQVSKNINQLRSRLATNRSSLDALKKREQNIRSDFDKQLVRYRFLLEEDTGESGDS
jgi:hypothetical protein